jgi:hypothetical protein
VAINIQKDTSLIIKGTFQIAILIVVSLFIYSLYHRWIYLDDAWFAEQAYQLSHTGFIRSEIFQGLLSYEERLLPAHKLHVIHGAIFIKLFGFSPYVIKAVPIPYVLLLIFILYKYTTSNCTFKQSYSFLLLVLLFISHAFVFDYAYIFRPELMQACVGFASFYFLEKSIRLQQLKFAAIGGLLTGICALFHLNGLVFIMSGGLVLLVNNQIKSLFLFGTIASLTSLLYFYDICCLQENIDLFVYQFQNDPALEKSNFNVWAYASKLFDEHMRLFRTIREGTLSVLFFLSVFLLFRFLKSQHSLLLSYTFFLIFSVALITRDTNGQYYLLYLPFMVLIVAISADYTFSTTTYLPKLTVWLLLFTYLGLNLYLINKIITKRTDILAVNQAVTSHIPQGARLMSSMYLVFNGLPQYDIQTVESYTLNRKKNLIPASISFLDFCRLHEREYIAIAAKDLENIHMSAEELKDGNEAYTYLTTTKGYILLRRRE